MNRSFAPVRSLLLLTTFAVPAFSQTLIEFKNGDPANAPDVNANFVALKTATAAAQALANAAQDGASEATIIAAAAQNSLNALTPIVNELQIGISAVNTAFNVQPSVVEVSRRLQFLATVANRRIVLFPNADNDHQFFGFGVAANTLRYQVNGASDSHVFSAGASATSSNELMRIVGNGNVGIGVSNPTAKLDVGGNVRLRVGDQLRFGADNDNGDPVFFQRVSGASDESVLIIKVGNDAEIFDRIDFSMGGSVAPTFQFLGNGTALKSGGGSWSVLSDARKKRNIRSLDGSLAQLLALRGTTFEYIDPKEAGGAPGTQTGFIAQEVEKVIPEWVHELPSGTKYLTITGFEARTVEALRELDTKNTQLAAENEALRARVAQLESIAADVAQMKTAMQAMLAK